MDRYQLVPTFDYDDSDDGEEFIDPHGENFWGAAAADVTSSAAEYDGNPEGDGRSSRNQFRLEDDCESVYFPKRYGIDAPNSFAGEDDALFGYYHVTDSRPAGGESEGCWKGASQPPASSALSSISGLKNASQTSLSFGGDPTHPVIAFTDQRLAGLSYFDDSDSDDDGAIRGAGGRTLDTISEEDENDLCALEDDDDDDDDDENSNDEEEQKQTNAAKCRNYSDVSDDDFVDRKSDARRRRIGSAADGDDSSFGDMDDVHMNSDGSVIFDCFTRNRSSSSGRPPDVSLSPSSDHFE
jgi:hypothetical protein